MTLRRSSLETFFAKQPFNLRMGDVVVFDSTAPIPPHGPNKWDCTAFVEAFSPVKVAKSLPASSSLHTM